MTLAEDMSPHRGGEDRSSATAASSRSTPTASSTATRRSPTPRRCRPTSCAGTRSRATRSTSRRIAEVSENYDGALSTGENLFSTQDVENLVRFGGLKAAARRHHPGRSAAGLRHRAIRPHARHAGAAQLAALRPVPARRQPDVAAHRRRLRAGRRGILSRRVRRRSRASPTTPSSRTAISSCRTAPASASRARRRSTRSCATSPRRRPRAEACYAPRHGDANAQAADLERPARAGAAAAAAVRP